MNLTKKLQKMNACVSAIEWVSQMNGSNPEKLWNECERGDWMLWLVGKLDIDRKRLVLAACRCARLVEHLMKDEHSIIAIEVAEAWTRDEATTEELDRAAAVTADAVAAAAADAAYYAAADAAYYAVAYYAADAAADAVAYYAADAAYAAAYAAADARDSTLIKCANIARQHFTFDEVWEALQNKD